MRRVLRQTCWTSCTHSLRVSFIFSSLSPAHCLLCIMLSGCTVVRCGPSAVCIVLCMSCSSGLGYSEPLCALSSQWLTVRSVCGNLLFTIWGPRPSWLSAKTTVMKFSCFSKACPELPYLPLTAFEACFHAASKPIPMMGPVSHMWHVYLEAIYILCTSRCSQRHIWSICID